MEDGSLAWVFIIVVLVGYFAFKGEGTSDSTYSDSYYSFSDYEDVESRPLEDLEADELRDLLGSDISEEARETLFSNYFSGTKTFEACNESNGNCYEVEADVSDGEVETIYFNNGGYVDAYGELDEYGAGEVESEGGNQVWELNCLDCD